MGATSDRATGWDAAADAASGSQFPPAKSLADEIRIQQVISLVRLIPALVVGNLVVPVIVIATLWSVLPAWFILTWLAAVLALLVPMFLNWWRFRNAPVPDHVSERRIRSVTLWSLMMGCVLGAGAAYVLGTADLGGQIPVYMLVLGLWAGALCSIWMIPRACVAYATPMGLGMAIAGHVFDLVGKVEISVAVVLFILIMAVFLRMNWQGYKKSVQAIVDRDRLLASQTEEIGRRRAAEQRLEQSLADLHQAQDQLVLQEKMASLGALTAGIAHEIKNPLNFINNFSDVSGELLQELKEAIEPALGQLDEDGRQDVTELTGMLSDNLQKITRHGQRADGIVKGMLMHSRGGASERIETDINALVEEAMNLAYHGARAQDQGFNITLEKDFDPAAGTAVVAPQEITRVLVNLCGNGFYAATRTSKAGQPGFEPVLKATTRRLPDEVEIRIRDNGIGMSEAVREKLFTPFFTTKPTGEGTGLGLSLSYDIIVQQHKGTMTVDSMEGEFAEFVIRLPVAGHPMAQEGAAA